MLKLTHILSVLLALAMLQPNVLARNAGVPPLMTATLEEAKGAVFKRDFVDWQRDVWADPQPAARGDTLREGMQLGTGDSSWAKVTWPGLSTFAWANSLYALAPNRRLVFLTNGELLYHLDKRRRDKSPYFVWTKLLSARIDGTTVLVQAGEGVSKITVLEGAIEVTNRLDHSRIKLSPGMVYEIRDRSIATHRSADSLTPISLPDLSWSLFETKQTASTLRVADPTALLNHPLVTAFADQLPSLSLVETAMHKLQQTVDVPNVEPAAKQLLKSAVTIASPPLSMEYQIGSNAAALMTFDPGIWQYFPPTGSTSNDGLPAKMQIAASPSYRLPSTAGMQVSFPELPIANVGSIVSHGTVNAAASSAGITVQTISTAPVLSAGTVSGAGAVTVKTVTNLLQIK